MSRRCADLMRRRALALTLGLATTALALGGPAAAATPKPLVMGPLYTEPSRPAANPAPPSAGGCPVRIVEIVDARRGPETVGSIMTFRAMQAPADRQAWLRSVFAVGLAARGFKPTIADDGQPAPGVVSARVRIRAMWLSTLQMNKTGSVVLQASVAGPGATPGAPDKIYRGDRTTINMMGSQGEFNELLNQLFSEALDNLSADLRPLCGPATTAAAAQP